MRLTLTIGLILTSLLIGCSSGSDSHKGATYKKLDIEPPLATLDVGSSERFKALVLDSEGLVKDVSNEVSWYLEFDSGILEPVDSPEHPGLSFALAVMSGQDNLVAGLGSLTAKSAITVVEAELIELTITPNSADMLVASEQAFTAEGEYDDGHTEDLTDESTWSSENGSIVSITDEGVATAQVKGTALISASLDGVSDTANITVHELVEVVSIEVTPADITLFLESSRFFAAIAHYSDGSMQGVTEKVLWRTSDSTILAHDAFWAGLFHTGRVEGEVELSALLSSNTKGSTTVTVEEVVVTHIVTTPKNFSLPEGKTKRYFTEAATSDGKFASVNQYPSQSYTVSDPSVAYISNNPDNKGMLTGLRVGTVVVMSTFEYEGETFTDQATLTVCVESGC